jgi:hypothetical protein
MNQMPQIGDCHRRLHLLAGDWIGDERISPSPWGPGGPAVGRLTARVACDGFSVVEDYEEEKDGQVCFRGHGVFTWDGQRQDYAWYWVDSMGIVPPAPSRGVWTDDTLVFTSEGCDARGRYTYRFDGADRFHFRIENSHDDGATWQTMIEGDYRRK